MPNSFAYLMLAIWPLVALLLFRKLPLERAVIWCLLAGYLLLPPTAAFDLPLVPAMDKHSIPAVTALILCFTVAKTPVRLLSTSRAANLLIFLYIACAVPTVLTNGDPHTATLIENAGPIQIEMSFRTGLTFRDLGSFVLSRIIDLIPFFLGLQLLASSRSIETLLRAFIWGALGYTLLAWIEIFAGPNLNIWVYGFLQHELEQLLRGGGYRPIVFLQHALWVALFMATTCVAAISFARNSDPKSGRFFFALTAIYLLVFLVAAKNLASQLYAVSFGVMVLLLPLRWQFRFSLLLVLIVVVYPMMRYLGLVPLDTILAWAQDMNPARAESLEYRIINEEILMERAHDKPWFGWGGWARNLILEVQTGIVLTIPDGRWIIAFGEFGWLGYLSEMGLLALPILLLWLRSGSRNPLPVPVTILVVIVAITMLDMLLNATLTTLTWLSVGALLGFAEQLKMQVNLPSKPSEARLPPILGHTRKEPGKRTII